MSCEKIQHQELLQPQKEEAIMDFSSSFDNHTTTNLHVTTNNPPCSNCGCSGSAASSVPNNYKRPSSEPSLSPNPKKQNANATANSPFAFTKIPLPAITAPTFSPSLSPSQPPLRRTISDPCDPLATLVAAESPQSQPPLRRTVSDPCDPLTTLVAAESPQSPPQKNADNVACSGTPFSAAKLPPRPPTSRRSVSELMPSPAKTFSSSCDTGTTYEPPNARLARRMSTCFHEMTRKLDELLTVEEESGSKEDTMTNQINNNQNNDETMGNSEEGYIETVAEKIGEFLSMRLTCPCGQSYQILLSGHNCYYRVS